MGFDVIPFNLHSKPIVHPTQQFNGIRYSLRTIDEPWLRDAGRSLFAQFPRRWYRFRVGFGPAGGNRPASASTAGACWTVCSEEPGRTANLSQHWAGLLCGRVLVRGWRAIVGAGHTWIVSTPNGQSRSDHAATERRARIGEEGELLSQPLPEVFNGDDVALHGRDGVWQTTQRSRAIMLQAEPDPGNRSWIQVPAPGPSSAGARAKGGPVPVSGSLTPYLYRWDQRAVKIPAETMKIERYRMRAKETCFVYQQSRRRQCSYRLEGSGQVATR
jgi:hypothetical protein